MSEPQPAVVYSGTIAGFEVAGGYFRARHEVGLRSNKKRWLYERCRLHDMGNSRGLHSGAKHRAGAGDAEP
jgi:hypothetical protein